METIKSIGKAVSWAIDQWKKLEEIRKLKAQTELLKMYTIEEISDMFDRKAIGIIDVDIDKIVASLPVRSLVAGRDHEQRIALNWAYHSLLAHIERGMTVEIRYSLPEKKLAENEEPDLGRDKLRDD